MNRLQKKCILASMLLHGLLLLVILFGAAFQKKPAPILYQRINVFPTKTVEDALAGGGGNPNLTRSDDQVKGTPKPQPQVTPPTPKPPEPQPSPVPPRPEARKPEPARQPPAKPPEPSKPNLTTKAPVTPKLDLTPTIRNNNTKAREKDEAATRQAREAERNDANLRREIAGKLAKPATGLQAGFESGVKFDVGGPGGEAYANYAFLVQTVYDSAWQVLPDLASEDFIVPVEVVIARDGHIVSQRILTRSGNSAMDRSVQRALDKVKASGLSPFPEGTRDAERTFKIKFNLKARRLVG